MSILFPLPCLTHQNFLLERCTSSCTAFFVSETHSHKRRVKEQNCCACKLISCPILTQSFWEQYLVLLPRLALTSVLFLSLKSWESSTWVTMPSFKPLCYYFNLETEVTFCPGSTSSVLILAVSLLFCLRDLYLLGSLTGTKLVLWCKWPWAWRQRGAGFGKILMGRPTWRRDRLDRDTQEVRESPYLGLGWRLKEAGFMLPGGGGWSFKIAQIHKSRKSDM